jgi:hypothetical protein
VLSTLDAEQPELAGSQANVVDALRAGQETDRQSPQLAFGADNVAKTPFRRPPTSHPKS